LVPRFLAFGFFRRSSLDDGEREIPGGSRRFLGLSLRAEIRIPAPEGVLPLFVEHPGSYLQEKMCSTLAPPHLLFLHHPFDLSVSYEKVGGVLEAQGKLQEALDSYQQSLNIRRTLAEQDKSNAGWQRDLSVSLEKVGEVLVAQGKLDEALKV
jgi:tetratricopeptide (TPR) repeat protein